MEEIQNLFNNVWQFKIVNSIIVIIISVILYKIIEYIITKGEKRDNIGLFASNKRKTYLKLIKSIIRSIFIIVTVLIILQINGINVNSALTGVGIVGVIFGLAIQDWLKDIIRGSSILSDGYFEVGNIVKYKDIEGKVLVIGLKTTKIQELSTNNIVSIANRNIEEISVVSQFVYVKIPMPYEVPLVRAERVIEKITNLIKQNDNVNDCKYLGVNEFADSSILYLLQIDCNQQFKLQVRRDALRSILRELEKNKIEIPYTQIDIHNK